jgi:hypothetical protein
VAVATLRDGPVGREPPGVIGGGLGELSGPPIVIKAPVNISGGLGRLSGPPIVINAPHQGAGGLTCLRIFLMKVCVHLPWLAS